MTFLVRQNEFLVRQKDRALRNQYFILTSFIESKKVEKLKNYIFHQKNNS
jgi:hypothetical protein